MLDQFEEYFLYRSREPTPERFADEFARCISQPDLRASFLIAIREDAYAGLGDLFKGRIPNVYSNYLHVDYLDRASAGQAIRAPLDIYNSQPGISQPVHIQDELVEAVLDQVRAYDGTADGPASLAAANGGRDRVATPLLQLVMETIWEREREQRSHELRLSTLQELRGVNMIVDAHLGKALGALTTGERETAIDMFDHLVTPSGGKIAESVPDLAQRTGHREDQVGAVLDKLDHERIVRPVPAPPGHDPMRYRRYEIFHDVLAPTINRAIAAREERRRVRRVRRLASLVAGVIVICAVVGVFAYLFVSAAAERNTAESGEVAANADLVANQDPELSVLLALQALHLRDTSQADQALRTALPDLQAVRTLQTGATVISAAFDPVNSNEVASSETTGLVGIWNVRTRRRLATLSLGGFNHTGTADTVAFNPTGTQVAVGFGNGQVAVFNARGKKLHEETVTSALVNQVAFLGSTGFLAIATDQGVDVWEPGFKCCYSLSTEAAQSVAVDPLDDTEFAVATAAGTAIWDLSSSGSLQQQQLPQGAWTANDVAFSHNGRELVTAGSDGKLRVYDLATLQTVITLDASETDALTVAFSPDARMIVAGYASGRALVWDTRTWLQLTVLAGDSAAVESAQFSADSREVVTAGDDGTIRVWYAEPRELQSEFAVSHVGSTPTAALGAGYLTSRRILALDNRGDLYVFAPSGAWLAAISPPGTAVDSAAWDNAGTRVVTDDADGTVDVWQARGSGYAQVRLAKPISFTEPPADVEMSPDGSEIAIETSTDNGAVQVLSSHTGKLLWARDTNYPVRAMSFSPGGSQIYVGDFNGQLEVLSAATEHVQVLGRPGNRITDVEVSERGNVVVTMSESGTITAWAVRGDRPLALINTFDACQSPASASPSPNGSKIVVACGDSTVPVFDTATGMPLTYLPALSDGLVESAGFSPDGKSIAVTVLSIDGTSGVQVWSSALSNSSLSAIEKVAEQRVTRRLTPAERSEYLAGASGS
jgi:WD40 repeat protein